MSEKICLICEKPKDLSEFGIRRAEVDGRHYYCKPCQREKSRLYREQNPEKAKESVDKYRKNNPLSIRNTQLKIKYKITLTDLKSMIDAQNGMCYLCHRVFSDKWDERPAVDHNHTCCPGPMTCGKCLRKILCIRCNVWLGKFEDTPEMFLKAFEYLGGK